MVAGATASAAAARNGGHQPSHLTTDTGISQLTSRTGLTPTHPSATAPGATTPPPSATAPGATAPNPLATTPPMVPALTFKLLTSLTSKVAHLTKSATTTEPGATSPPPTSLKTTTELAGDSTSCGTRDHGAPMVANALEPAAAQWTHTTRDLPTWAHQTTATTKDLPT